MIVLFLRWCVGTRVCPPPPLLGTLDRGLTKATPEQVTSLRNLEADAVDDVIRIHGLSGSDTNAVLTWGRSEAQAQLFTRLLNALDEDEDDRSDDQQNAVDWMTTMMHRKAVAAAAAAGREYVTWAGLNQIRFEALLNANASESELREFLDDTPADLQPPLPGWRGLLRLSVARAVRFGVHGVQLPDLFRPVFQPPRLQPADTELRPVREVGGGGGELLAAEQ